jgi:hypothetical protein
MFGCYCRRYDDGRRDGVLPPASSAVSSRRRRGPRGVARRLGSAGRAGSRRAPVAAFPRGIRTARAGVSRQREVNLYSPASAQDTRMMRHAQRASRALEHVEKVLTGSASHICVAPASPN